jgi:apolipoprotein N-acyltransferase
MAPADSSGPGPRWPHWLRPQHCSQFPTVFRLIVAAISGAALGLSFIGFYITLFSWVCLGLLLIVLFGASPRVAALCGFLHGVAFVFTTLAWIAQVIQIHGGVGPAAAWAVFALLAAAWGVLTGGFAWCVNVISRRSIVRACCTAPLLWVTMEFIRNHLPEIGFPWNLLGYPAAANLALVQLTTITGIYGLSFLVAAFNALLAWTAAAEVPSTRRRVLILSGGAFFLLILMLFAPGWLAQAPARHYARLVQLNFPEAPSYPPDWFEIHRAELEEIEQISLARRAESPDLIVWPEVPAPFSFQDSRFAGPAQELARKAGKPFLAGVVEWKPILDSSGRVARTGLVPYNSAVLLDGHGKRVFSYDKVHLVPFGEYEPFPLIHRVVTTLSEEVGGFRRGSSYSVGQLPNGHRFGVFICYEAIFPGEVRRFTARGAELLVNISNDGWFGRSAAPDQHLRMARVRAVENRRWLLRATNNGYTVAIDPYGRIVAQLPTDVRAALDAPYDFRTDRTLYVRWGDWFAWLSVLTSIVFLALALVRGGAKSAIMKSEQEIRK